MKSTNKVVILLGFLLMAAVFCGILFYGKMMNPPAYYVLAAKTNIEANTSLVSLGEANFVEVDVSANRSMANTFVTRESFLAMQRAGGQFVRSVAQNEPIKYTDIVSSANPLASSQVTLGINDPNKVVMTINVSGYAPTTIAQGDMIDIIGVTTYSTNDIYNNELFNLMEEARQKATAQIKDAETLNTGFDFNSLSSDYMTSTSSAESFSFDNFSFGSEIAPSTEDGNMFTVTAPSIAEELQEKADELQEKANLLEEKLASWNEFLELYGSIDPVELAERARTRFYSSPVAKVLVHGAQVMHVGRADDAATSSVTTLDVLVPREDIEWISMMNEGGSLRVAVLPNNANPNGSGPTAGASMQDFLEGFVEDRQSFGDTYVPVPSSK